MIDVKIFFNELKQNNFDFFTGVPDSLLKHFCKYVEENVVSNNHIIAANEGNAVAIAAGYHLGTGKYPVVYMQNSGLGNTINPLTSLTNPEVYGIPMLLIIGWRGEPGITDEPQHVFKGKITPNILETLGVDYFFLNDKSDPVSVINQANDKMLQLNGPVAMLVSKNTFETYPGNDYLSKNNIVREDAINKILQLDEKRSIFISTTGKLSRELFEARVKRNEAVQDFLSVGSMGHASSIALGTTIGNPNKNVICLDGDGALLMHMGALPIIGANRPHNYIHILFNNGAHESVGGQPTVANDIDLEKIALGSGYLSYTLILSIEELEKKWHEIIKKDKPHFVEIKINLTSRKDLGRPTSTPKQNKSSFMKNFGEAD